MPRTPTARARGSRAGVLRVVCAVRKGSVDDQGLGAIHVPNVNQRAVFVRSTPVSHERIQIGCVGVVVTSACAVLLAQTGDRKGLVLPLGLRGVGAIVEAVSMVVGVHKRSVEPETREDSERGSSQRVG